MSIPGRSQPSVRSRRHREVAPTRRQHAPKAKRADFSARLQRCEPGLRTRLGRPAAVYQVLEQIHDRVDASEIAGVAITLLASWIPLKSWAVVALDLAGEPSVLAEQGIAPEMALTLGAVAVLVGKS